MERPGAFYLQAQPWARYQRNDESSRARLQQAHGGPSSVQQQEMSTTEREIMAYRGALFDAEESFRDSLGSGHRSEIVRSNGQRKAAILQYFSKVNFHYEQRMSRIETEAKRQDSDLNDLIQQNKHLKVGSCLYPLQLEVLADLPLVPHVSRRVGQVLPWKSSRQPQHVHLRPEQEREFWLRRVER